MPPAILREQNSPKAETEQDRTAPTVESLPRFLVVGVDRESESDVELIVEARTEANAKVKAELKGIIVTEVQPYSEPEHEQRRREDGLKEPQELQQFADSWIEQEGTGERSTSPKAARSTQPNLSTTPSSNQESGKRSSPTEADLTERLQRIGKLPPSEKPKQPSPSYVVRGVDRKSEKEVELTVEADNAKNARAVADIRGVSVTKVRRRYDRPRSMTALAVFGIGMGGLSLVGAIVGLVYLLANPIPQMVSGPETTEVWDDVNNRWMPPEEAELRQLYSEGYTRLLIGVINSLLMFAGGVGLWQGESWGRVSWFVYAAMMAILSLIGFNDGVVLPFVGLAWASFLFWLLTRPSWNLVFLKNRTPPDFSYLVPKSLRVHRPGRTRPQSSEK